MAAATSRTLFVNLAVKDLAASVEFFTRLGFRFDQRFTDENATCMIVGEDAFVMLLAESRFRDFTRKAICDSATQTEAILALTADSKDAVEELADLALVAGGTAANEPMDYGFMYGRSFNDVDGHLWEVFWMDPGALEAHGAEVAASSGSAS
jgi:predicted lactoylglutathione lyase